MKTLELNNAFGNGDVDVKEDTFDTHNYQNLLNYINILF